MENKKKSRIENSTLKIDSNREMKKFVVYKIHSQNGKMELVWESKVEWSEEDGDKECATTDEKKAEIKLTFAQYYIWKIGLWKKEEEKHENKIKIETKLSRVELFAQKICSKCLENQPNIHR